MMLPSMLTTCPALTDCLHLCQNKENKAKVLTLETPSGVQTYRDKQMNPELKGIGGLQLGLKESSYLMYPACHTSDKSFLN